MSDEPKPFTAEEVIALFPLLYKYHWKAEALFSTSLILGVLCPEEDKERCAKLATQRVRLHDELRQLSAQIDKVLHPPDGLVAEVQREMKEKKP